MRYTKRLSLILALALILSCVCTPVFATEDDAHSGLTRDCRGIDAKSMYLGADVVIDNVDAAFLYELNSDTVMYAANADTKMYPASLVKIMTALLAIREGNLEDIVTVQQAVLNSIPYNAVSAGLVAGEKLSLSDLLYCMMVGSANDAAAVIAAHISGSQIAFVQMMNQYAHTLGCTNTHFTNVHGLHDKRQHTTARDMARILAEAAKYDVFMEYISTVRYVVPATPETPNGRVLTTLNYLINDEEEKSYYDDRVIGGRTGITEDEKRCLASIAEVNGMRLLSVVMGSASVNNEDGSIQQHGSFKETSALLDAGFNGHKVVQILYKDQAVKQKAVQNGVNDVVLGATSSVYCVLPAEATISDLVYRFTDESLPFVAPIELGQIVTSAQVWYDGYCVAQVELYAMNGVAEYVAPEDPIQNIVEEEKESPAIIIIGLIVGGTILVIFLVSLVKHLFVLSAEKRKNQYRRNRRGGRR